MMRYLTQASVCNIQAAIASFVYFSHRKEKKTREQKSGKERHLITILGEPFAWLVLGLAYRTPSGFDCNGENS